MTLMVNVGEFQPVTQAMGPGLRACLWVRGCSIGCRHCGSPQFQNRDKNFDQPEWRISGWIEEAQREQGIEGISFSGGEPFDQAKALTMTARYARALGLSTLAFTGHTLEFLRSDKAPPGSEKLLEQLDILIDGPFIQSRLVYGTPLRGSANQTIHFLTDRYSQKDVDQASVELELNPTEGKLQIRGVTDYRRMQAVLSLLGANTRVVKD